MSFEISFWHIVRTIFLVDKIQILDPYTILHASTNTQGLMTELLTTLQGDGLALSGEKCDFVTNLSRYTTNN